MENATKRCDFYRVCPRLAVGDGGAPTGRAGAASARGSRRRRGRTAPPSRGTGCGRRRAGAARRYRAPGIPRARQRRRSPTLRAGAAPARRRGTAARPGHVRPDLRAGGLVLQRRRRVLRDADLRAPGVHRYEQATLIHKRIGPCPLLGAARRTL